RRTGRAGLVAADTARTIDRLALGCPGRLRNGGHGHGQEHADENDSKHPNFAERGSTLSHGVTHGRQPRPLESRTQDSNSRSHWRRRWDKSISGRSWLTTRARRLTQL